MASKKEAIAEGLRARHDLGIELEKVNKRRNEIRAQMKEILEHAENVACDLEVPDMFDEED